MKKFKLSLFVIVLMTALCMVNIHAGEKKEVTKTFEGKELVRIQTMTGNCIIKKKEGNEITVHVVYEPINDMFKPRIQEEGGTLVIRDKLPGSNGSASLWKITVPERTDIKFSSIAGSFSVNGLDGKIFAKTVAGDLSAEDCIGDLQLTSVNGEFKVKRLRGDVKLKGVSCEMRIKEVTGDLTVLNSSGSVKAEDLDGVISLKMAAGDIEIKRAKGEFKVKTASGNIEAEDIVLKKAGSFKVASGNVEVKLAESAAHDLNLAAGSGNVLLDYSGNAVKGWFEFRALAGAGEIISPFKFDKEEVKEKWGKKYDFKSFKKDGDSPKIHLYTSTGNAQLKK
ncbi:MAG: DUF4097 domain-containing protein [bacterium]|nr:DUF4097 domain-containing protein [bacterium]